MKQSSRKKIYRLSWERQYFLCIRRLPKLLRTIAPTEMGSVTLCCPQPVYGHWHVSGKKIGCRRCFVHAADYRWYGKWSSRICSGCVPPLSGYFARAKKPAERGGAEDFSLTRGISAAELTHIDHERKRMTRYFKPLQKWRRTNVFPISLCHCITDSFLPIDIQLVWLVIYARFLYHYGITTLSLATWMENRYSAYTYLYINILQIKTNNKHQIPISANHSIILCKNGYKIGKTEWFSFSGTVL